MTDTQETAVTAEAQSQTSPGVRLRAAREARAESINEVAFALKLHPRQVTALEEDDFQALPGEAFVRGFMRNYARYLGLDAAPLLTMAEQLGGAARADLSPVRNADGDLPNGGGAVRRSTRPLAWIIALLLLLLLGGWYFDWFRTEAPVGMSEARPAAETRAQADDRAALALPPPTAQLNLAPLQSASVLPPAVPADEGDPAAGDDDAAEADSAVAPADEATAEAAEATAAPEAAAPETVAAVEDSNGARLQFDFAGESWVEVRDGRGKVIHSGVNQAGSRRQLDGEPPFSLTIGNAASVRLEFDGKAVDLASRTKGTVARLKLE